LVWRAPCPEVPRPTSYIAPSWPWASVTLGNSDQGCYDLGYIEIHEEDDAQLLYIGVESFNGDPFSKVNSGFICIRARGQEITQLDDDIVIFDDPQDEKDFKDFISISHG
jgi:hypothetical protein